MAGFLQPVDRRLDGTAIDKRALGGEKIHPDPKRLQILADADENGVNREAAHGCQPFRLVAIKKGLAKFAASACPTSTRYDPG